jgi:glycosyltransferase involved in cell wall biosynthesis
MTQMAKGITNFDVSVVIPTYGNEPALLQTIEEILQAYPQTKRKNLEILIVHTPKDGSELKIKKVEQEYAPMVRVIIENRKGYGIAYMTGFENARGNIIATLDADLTYPAKDIPQLCKALEIADADFITTNRLKEYEPGAFHWSHGFGNKFLTLFMNMLFMTGLHDSQSGMWIFKKSIWPKLDCVGLHWEFSSEIKLEAIQKRLRYLEIPIYYRRRRSGFSTNSVREGIKIAIFMLAKRIGLARSFAVLRR